jgi:hypothetical protein
MLKSLGSAGLVLATLGAGLGLYFVSFTVAAERNGIEKLERQIARDRQHIRELEAELGVRANMPLLERWNAEVLALSAPKAGQILETGVELADLRTPRAIGPAETGVRLAGFAAVPRQAPAAATVAKANTSTPVVRPAPTDLFSVAVAAEIDAAAAREPARLTKVTM